jgi:outer membrane receptor protein involved in Fe transport
MISKEVQQLFTNWDIRYAKKISDKLAYKIGAELATAQDWQAQDYSNLSRNNVFSTPIGGTRATDQGYDGVNVYGDEAAINMQALAMSTRLRILSTVPGGSTILSNINNAVAAGLPLTSIITSIGGPSSPLMPALPFLLATSPTANNPYANAYRGNGSGLLSRTGYNENVLVDYNNYNIKLNGAIHYKITNNIEASISANYGQGTTVYTGSDRYSVKNLRIGQYKAEVKGKDWFLRAYTTQENSGDAFTATTAAVAINNSWKSNTAWFGQYMQSYSAAYFGLAPGVPASVVGNVQNADAFARGIADGGRLMPGTAAFNQAYENAINTPISKGGINQGGAKFNDQTSLYHYEGQYRFSQIKAVDIMVGASYRQFNLRSNGTIFADNDGPISINEVGGYVQLQKKFLDDKLKATLSGRYDKNSNFDGRFTPRATLTYEVKKNNFFRFSYQQAYRFPSTQDQWINLRTPGSILIGGNPYFKDFYNLNSTNPLQNVYTAESVAAFRNTLMQGIPNPTVLKVATFNQLKPEVSNSFELGFRGLVTKDLLIDAYVYYSQFTDFIGRQAVARSNRYTQGGLTIDSLVSDLLNPSNTDNISFVTNSPDVVKAIGWGVSAEYKFYKSFMLNANVSGDQLDGASENLFTQYNTPAMRFNIGVSNPNVYKNFGFGAIYRWQDKINWQGTFGTGEIPAYGTVDGFISYKFEGIKSLLKIGATNLYNKYYRSAFGNPQVGGLYYVSFGYNVF